MEYKGIGYLRTKLASKRGIVLRKYRYYDMVNQPDIFWSNIPEKYKSYVRGTLGWCAKSVDSLADRLVFRGFKDDNFNLAQIYQMNNNDILFDSAILGALISACDFIFISPDDDGFPRLQVIDGANATGIYDPITGMLTEGYAVLQRDDQDNVVREAYFIAGRTDFYERGVDAIITENNVAPYPLLVPIIYRPDAKHDFGHSRISRACMELQKSAVRTVIRSEVSAEFYSFPQKYVLGLSDEAEQLDSWKATVSSFLRFDRDEEGNVPSVGMFSQQSMSPYNDQLRTFAGLFAGETGLTLDDLGFPSQNPSSAEAIKSSHESLRLTARKAQRTFGTGFLNAGYLAACIRDNYPYERRQIYQTRAQWMPIFEPDAAMLSGIGDGVNKINQAIPGYIGSDNMVDLTGIEADE